MPQPNEPKPSEATTEDETTAAEKDELEQEELDGVSGGLMVIGGATLSGGTASATLIEDDDPLIP